ncbi:MAG: penicillin-binding protein activator LpoB [Pseudomonadales bacterium]|nr:penicillin-binding protein activator LpoB [Pseudomonadales bacterium]
MFIKRTVIACSIIAAMCLGGCANQVQYGDANGVETVNTDFGSTDLQLIASHMVDSLLAFPPIQRMTASGVRPILFVDTIKNQTMEHIDTSAITDSIMTKLLDSGQFRFVDMTAMAALRKQLDYQHNSGMVDESKAVAMGQQIGAQYMLYGNLMDITKQNSSVRDVFYKFTMKMTNVRTGEVIWESEKQIRKVQKRSWFGM